MKLNKIFTLSFYLIVIIFNYGYSYNSFVKESHNLTIQSERYHVIVASFKTESLAQKELVRLNNSGYELAKILYDENGKNFRISIMSFDQILQTTKTDNAGLYKIAIPGENKDLENLRLVIGENLIFRPLRKNLDFSETFKINFDAGVGPSLRMKEPLYMINKDNAHFREKPDIGSKTLFLLEKGEVVSVQRITPSEFKVSIEVKFLNSVRDVYKFEGTCYKEDAKVSEAEFSAMITYK